MGIGTLVIVRIEPGTPRSTVETILSELGVGGNPGPGVRWHRSNLLTVRARWIDAKTLHELGSLPGVAELVSLPSTSRLFERQDPAAEIPLARSVIAGPCAVEGSDQIRAAAEIVADAGARGLRGGVFKPRTSPYDFGGLGEKGLEYLARAGEESGLATVTEVLRAEQLDVVAQYVDVFQIGTRNMHNFALLFDVGAHPSGLPVLLKRGFGATVDEWLEATEYVLLGRMSAGRSGGIILCERGVRSFDSATRFMLDVGAIAVVRKRTNLPVIADPSHAAGERSLVSDLARAAVGAGATGLLVEVHPDPDNAWCDGAQSLDQKGFRSLMRSLGHLGQKSPTAIPA